MFTFSISYSTIVIICCAILGFICGFIGYCYFKLRKDLKDMEYRYERLLRKNERLQRKLDTYEAQSKAPEAKPAK